MAPFERIGTGRSVVMSRRAFAIIVAAVLIVGEDYRFDAEAPTRSMRVVKMGQLLPIPRTLS